MERISWRGDELRIEPSEVLRFLGYQHRPASSEILRRIDEELSEAVALLDPVALVGGFDAAVAETGLLLDGGVFSKSVTLRERLAGVDRVWLCAYTIGNRLDLRVSELSSDAQMARGLVLDKIGIAALDSLQSMVRAWIENREQPRTVCCRVFPVQGDLPIALQAQILTAIGGPNAPISVNSHHQLSPLKSVAVILGIGESSVAASACAGCEARCLTSSLNRNTSVDSDAPV
ncbi:MAG: hypothetical protein RBS17_08050 [Coriobacteriia bacterium]|nr:hypothetical protein [Coriobacteriia bacterium]